MGTTVLLVHTIAHLMNGREFQNFIKNNQ
jgi:cellobiose-specific phosphotransferase system component IIA